MQFSIDLEPFGVMPISLSLWRLFFIIWTRWP